MPTENIQIPSVVEQPAVQAKQPRAKLTPEQKREKRNAYAREYYKKHPDKIKAICKASRAKAKAAKAQAVQPAAEAQAEQPSL